MSTHDREPLEHTYRFAPRDRTGWLLGLQGPQLAIIAAGIVAAALTATRVGLVAAALVLVAALSAAFGRIRGEPASAWLTAATRFWSRPKTSFTPIPGHGAAKTEANFPGALASARVIDSEAFAWAGPHRVGLVANRRERALTGVIRVRGRRFALAERAEQERLVHLWGEAIGAFCRERTPIRHVSWSHWSTPTAAATPLPNGVTEETFADYETAARRLVATEHDVLITVTVTRGRTAATTLSEQLRLLTLRLEDAGLLVDPPLSATDLRRAVARRCDPEATATGPLGSKNAWRHLTMGASLHAAMWVAEWPRCDLPPNWLEPMLMASVGTRSFTLSCRPVPPSRSRRQIERDVTRLTSDAEQRTRHGFRLSTTHRRVRDSVEQREAELGAGHAELTFVGILTATAPHPAQLETTIAELEQVAAQAGLVLARLDGRHDLAFAAALPLGFDLQRRNQ